MCFTLLVAEFDDLLKAQGVSSIVWTHIVHSYNRSIADDRDSLIKTMVHELQFVASDTGSSPNAVDRSKVMHWEEIKNPIVLLDSADPMTRLALHVWALEDIQKLLQIKPGADPFHTSEELLTPCPFVVNADKLRIHLTEEDVEHLAKSLVTAADLRVPDELERERDRLDEELDRLLRAGCLRLYVNDCEKVRESRKLWTALRRLCESSKERERQIVFVYKDEPPSELLEVFKGSLVRLEILHPEKPDTCSIVSAGGSHLRETHPPSAQGRRISPFLTGLLIGGTIALALAMGTLLGRGSPSQARIENVPLSKPIGSHPADVSSTVLVPDTGITPPTAPMPATEHTRAPVPKTRKPPGRIRHNTDPVPLPSEIPSEVPR